MAQTKLTYSSLLHCGGPTLANECRLMLQLVFGRFVAVVHGLAHVSMGANPFAGGSGELSIQIE